MVQLATIDGASSSLYDNYTVTKKPICTKSWEPSKYARSSPIELLWHVQELIANSLCDAKPDWGKKQKFYEHSSTLED